jgi:hypothetical protein
MGNDGDIAYRLGHRWAFPSVASAKRAIGWGLKNKQFRAFSLHILPLNQCARWLLLKEKATQLLGFCKHLK